MLCRAYSAAIDRVKLITPALAAPYADKPYSAIKPASDDMLMITPPPCAIITGNAHLLARKGAVRLTANARVPVVHRHVGHQPERTAGRVVVQHIEPAEGI